MTTARLDVATPALVVDLEVLDANIAAMASRAAGLGVALRPHVKTHKCVEIARRQVAASGSTALTVATVSEAEVFAAAGFDDLFIAYPLWVDDALATRLRQVARSARVLIGCDSVAAARQAGSMLRDAPLGVLVEVDSGHHRSGVAPSAAAEVARAALDAGLRVDGVFTFPGHSYAAGTVDDAARGRRAGAADEHVALAAAASALRSAGVSTDVVSGGSSPSMAFASVAGLTELRPGAYVFNDAQQWELGACDSSSIALTAYATVVSHAGGRLVLNVGSKVLGADRAPYATGSGRLLDHPNARIVQLSEHHAVCDLGSERLPELGSIVRAVPNHCCNAVNLTDELVIVQGGVQIDTWRVAARGANT